MPPRRSLPDWLEPVAQRLSPTIKALVIAETLAYLVFVFAVPLRAFIVEYLTLGPLVIRGLRLWQPVTALFVHVDALSLVFNIIGLWFVGATVEQHLGLRRFWTLFLVPGVLSYVAQGLVVTYLPNAGLFSVGAGCGDVVLGFFVVFGQVFGRTPARVLGGLVLEARKLTAILVAFALFVDLVSSAWPSLAGTVVACASAYVLGKSSGAGRGDKPNKPKRRYQVLEGGRKDPPGYVN